MLALGCSGIVSVAAHVIGDEMKQMVDAWFAGDIAAATAWHLYLYPMFKGIFVTTNPVPIKALVNMNGLKAGGVRLPLVDATLEEERFLTKLLVDIKSAEAIAASGIRHFSESNQKQGFREAKVSLV